MEGQMLLFAALSAVVVTLVSAQIGSTCAFSQQEVEKDVMECLAHEPKLLLEVMGHLKNPQSMATVDFVCQNQKEVIEALLCLEDKLASCYPLAKDVLKQYMPNQARLNDAMQLMCDHRKDFLKNDCMNQDQVQEFMKCYMGKLTTILQTVRSDHDVQTAVCSVIHSEEQCIQKYHGSCTSSYVAFVIQFLNKLFPYCPNLVFDLKDQVPSDVLGSILIHGQPLKFQPQGEAKYNVVNG